MPDPGSPGFEGPEKKIEIEFRLATGHRRGLFEVSDDTWQRLLDFAKVTIIGKKETELCKMYVLSESSLFVYKRKLVIKTCGTTTLLDMISPLLELVASERNDMNASLPECLCLETEYMSYSRKNYLYPDRQPHRGKFPNEVEVLENLFPGGGGYVLGPINKDHWNFFLADYTYKENELTNPGDQTLEVIMTELDEEKMKIFFNENGSKTAEEVTSESGIDKIIPGSVISAKVFDPCGYSMNGLFGDEDHYWTIHVTPETHCSFVSFETSLPWYVRHPVNVVVYLNLEPRKKKKNK